MSCSSPDDPATSRTLEVSQGAGERQPYDFFLTKDLSRRWAPGPHGVGAAVRPATRKQTGLEYVSSGGVSGEFEPIWPTASGGTVRDGTITWTARAISTDSLGARIASAVWSATGINATDQVETDEAGEQSVRIIISGGSAGQIYEVVGLVTDTLGYIHLCRLLVTVY